MTALRAAVVLAAAAALRLAGSRRAARRRAGGSRGLRTDDGVRLHVQVGGDGQDASPTVVLVHGFAARSSMWDAQWDRLCAHARVVRYDLRGHGRSGWAGRLRVGPDRLGRDLGQVVDRYGGPGPVVLVGHSMGGMAVLALAGQRPELVRDRVAGVALLSTLAAPLALAGTADDPTGPDGPGRRVRSSLTRAAAWGLWLAAPVVHALHPFRTRPVQRLLRGRLFAADPPEAAVREMTDAWTTTPTAVMAAHLPGLAGYDRRAAIEALRGVPVLVLTGAEDATVPASAVARLARRIGPRARLLTVPGAGHMVPLTHPGVVTPALLDLLARCRAADGRRTS